MAARSCEHISPCSVYCSMRIQLGGMHVQIANYSVSAN